MSPRSTIDHRAASWAAALVLAVLAVAVVGSGNLRWFDAALVGYLFGTLFADLRRRLPLPRLAAAPADGACSTGGAGRRSAPGRAGATPRRCPGWWRSNLVGADVHPRALALAVDRAPAGVLGLRPGRAGHLPARVRLAALRVGRRQTAAATARSSARSARSASTAAACSAGSSSTCSTSRRCSCSPACSSSSAAGCAIPGALAVERSNDFLALAGLFAVSVTGLALTASNLWMEGRFYVFLNTVHALTVILGLMYIPFGKLFHIFQRPANLGVAFYKRAGAGGEQQRCSECGDAVRVEAADGRPEGRAAAGRLRLLARATAATTRTSARAAGGGSSRSRSPHASEVSADGAAPGQRGRAHRPLRTAPQPDARRAAGTPGIEVDREVKTHCCFCGQQCGIILKVKDDEVVGFEPLVRVPVQRGQALPEGRQALPAERPPRPPARAARARPVDARRVPADRLGRRARSRRRARSAASRRPTAPTRSRCSRACRSTTRSPT